MKFAGCRYPEQLHDLLRSPQFRRQLHALHAALVTGQISLSYFGLDGQVCTPETLKSALSHQDMLHTQTNLPERREPQSPSSWRHSNRQNPRDLDEREFRGSAVPMSSQQKAAIAAAWRRHMQSTCAWMSQTVAIQ